MKFVPNAVSTRVARQILLGRKHSPTILFAGGVVGVVATTVTACRATLRSEEVLQEHGAKVEKAKQALDLKVPSYTETDYKKDLTYIYIQTGVEFGKLYGPSILLGVASIAALTGSHRILSSRNAALSAAYAALDRGFREYRNRVIEEFGSDKDRELRHATEERTIVEETKNGPKKKQVKHHAGEEKIYAKLFREGNPNWDPRPEYNLLFLRQKQRWLTDKLRSRGHLFLNEVYEELGLDHTKAGAMCGWIIGEGDDYVDFGVWSDENLDRFHDFAIGREQELLLDFNVVGPIYDKI